MYLDSHNYCHLSEFKDAMFGILHHYSSPTASFWHCHVSRDRIYFRN